LDTVVGANDQFQWDGSNASPIATGFDGIQFILDASDKVDIYHSPAVGSPSVYDGITDYLITPGGHTDFISSSLLSLVLGPSSAPVPGPIPLFGAAAAFGCGRQLRRRIKTQA
jgi:hypothetical protein